MTLALLLSGLAALLAGFTSAFAGFGTGLVAAGFWFQVLPVEQVPLLICITSVLAQLVSRFGQFKQLPWMEIRLFLGAALVGIVPGIWALQMWSPELIRLIVGVVLIVFAAGQLSGWFARMVNTRTRSADSMAGLISGSLGGFAGLSGVIMAMWLQTGGRTVDDQRSILQGFNLIILTVAGLALWLVNPPTETFATIAIICLPMTLIGAILGRKIFHNLDKRLFQRIVLILLLIAGFNLMIKSSGLI
jgi:uncharacterized protein